MYDVWLGQYKLIFCWPFRIKVENLIYRMEKSEV